MIIAEEDWRPPPERSSPPPAPSPKPSHTPRVPVRIQWNEKDLQRCAKAAGGLWDPRRKLWYVPEVRVKQLGLAGHIVR